ncbi:MAG: SDR family NAD(P)-dependent oxidoreductase, partial [Halioglobus sp.]
MARQKTALVTGGAQRIGREIALHLHRRGFHILLHYRSSVEAARDVQTSLNRERDGSCDLVQGSLDSDTEVAVLVEQV